MRKSKRSRGSFRSRDTKTRRTDARGCEEIPGRILALGRLGPFSAVWFPAGAGHNFINLNQYLTTNRLRAVDHDKLDLRTVNQYFEWWIADPTPEGVKKILTVGAPQ